jgi:hypothetical protein
MKRAFYDPATRVLKCWGFVETNTPGDLARDVPEDYATDIGTVTLNAAGNGDDPYTPPPPLVLTREEQAAAAWDALSSSDRALGVAAAGVSESALRERFIAAYP